MPVHFDISPEEASQISELLRHPRERMPWLLQAAGATSQKKKAQQRKRQKVDMKEKIEKWRAKAGSRTVDQALSKVHVEAQKPGQSKRKAKKKQPGKLKAKPSALVKKKKKQAQKAVVVKEAKAAVKAAEASEPVCDQTGRVVGETGPAAWQGRCVTVRKERADEYLCVAGKAKMWVKKRDLEMPAQAEFAESSTVLGQLRQVRTCLDRHPRIQIRPYELGRLLTDDQIHLGLLEAIARLQAASQGDVRWESVHVAQAAEVKAALDTGDLTLGLQALFE